MINPIVILVNYLFLFIVSKIDKYELYIDDEYYYYRFLDTQACVEDYLDIKRYNSYKKCVSRVLFENSTTLNEFPESQNKYLQKFIDELGNEEDEATSNKNFKTTYFEFMLEMLEISATDENYNSIYKYITESTNLNKDEIYSDIKSGKIDVKKITDDRYNKVAEKLYYKNFFNDISKTYEEKNFNTKDFFKSDVKNEDIFLEVLNEELLSNTGTTDDLRFFINYHDSYNIKGMELDRGDINKRGIENVGILNKTEIDKFNRFLVDYQSRNIETIIEKMDKNEKSEYNIFDMIFNLSTFLKNDLKIMYLYEKDENNELNITSKIDPDSIYEDSESFSESIYNLIYAYYSVIYNIYQNEKNYNEQEPIYYYDDDKIVYDFIDVAALNALTESDFYQSIYSTMIFIERQNGVKNRYISESIDLVNELLNFYTSNHELGKIEKIEKEKIKEEIGDQNEINYEKDINDSYDVLFKENTFMDLIDYESDYSVYFSQLQEYIKYSCIEYNRNKFYSKGISVIELQDYYNTRVLDSGYVLNTASDYCQDNYEKMFSDWRNSVSKSVDDSFRNVEGMRNTQLLAIDSFVRKVIYDDITNKINDQNKPDTLTKRDDNLQGKKYESQFNNPNNRKSGIILLKNKITKNLKNIFKRQHETEMSTFRKKLKEDVESEYERFSKEISDAVEKDAVSLVPNGDRLLKAIKYVSEAVKIGVKITSAPEIISDVAEFTSNLDLMNQLQKKYNNYKLDSVPKRDLKLIGGKEINDRISGDFHRFHLQHCRNDEIKFFSLARNYDRIMGIGKPYLKESINGFDGEIDIKPFSVPSSMKDTEAYNELVNTKNQFKDDMKKIFINYLGMKYEDYKDNNLASTEMWKEIQNFNTKLEILSEREAFYSRDLSKIVEKLDTFKTLDEMKNEYPLDKLTRTVKHLLDSPYSIEKGYADLVTNIDKKFFHEYDENNKQGKEKYDAGNSENDYDKLTPKQKTVISDVMYESPLNLNAIVYSDENVYTVQPRIYMRELDAAKETVNNINNYYLNQFTVDREPVYKLVRPKKFLSNNREVTEPNDEEDVFYTDKNNKIKKADFSDQTYFKSKSNEPMQKKEYILPDEPGKAYIASKEEYKSSSSSLPPNQKFIVSDENGGFTFAETDKNGKITNGEDIANKKSYSCKQVDVEYAEMIIPDNIQKNSNIPEEKKSTVYSYKDGFVQSKADDKYLKYKFIDDNTEYEGYANAIYNGIASDPTKTDVNDSYNKANRVGLKKNKIKNIYKKSTKYLNKVYEKIKKVAGKKGKGGKGKKPGKGN